MSLFFFSSRRRHTRLQGDWSSDVCSSDLVGRIEEIAARKRCTPAQLALAWLLTHPNVVPIPGSKSRSRLEENARAVDVALSAGDIAAIEEAAPKGAAAGARDPSAGMATVQR